MSEEKITITKSELSDPRIEEIVAMEKAAKRPVSAVERAPVETGILLNPIFYTGAAAVLGAFLAWCCIEPLIGKTAHKEGGIGLTLLFPVSSAMIGLMVGLIEGVMSRNFVKALKCGGIGLGVGLAWGTVGLMVAGIVFQLLIGLGVTLFPPPKGLKDDDSLPLGGLFFMLMVARSVGWTIVGSGMGLGQGVASASKKLTLNGIAGGLMGGFVGGMLFDPIGLVTNKLISNHLGFISPGAISRMVGLCAIGLFVGIFIGLVENLSKEAWFIMKSGPLRGKQFVIYNNPMVIGSSPKCDIYIFKDPAIEPKHAEVFQLGNKFELRDNNSPQGVFVNGTRITKKILEKGDIVVFGESVLEFGQKEKG